MSRVLVRPLVRAVVGAALCSAGLLAAAPLSPAAATIDPQRLVEQAPVVPTDVSVRPQGLPVRSTAATGTPPQIAYSVTQRNAAGTTATAVVRLNPLTAQARTVVASRGRLLFANAWSDDRARIYYDAVDVPVEGDFASGDVDSVPQGGGSPGASAPVRSTWTCPATGPASSTSARRATPRTSSPPMQPAGTSDG